MDLDDFEAETDALRRDLEERQQRRLAGCELPTWPLPEPETPPMSRNTTGFDAVAAQRPAPRPHQRAAPALSVPVLEAVMREVGIPSRRLISGSRLPKSGVQSWRRKTSI
jgi:hypothetical protein